MRVGKDLMALSHTLSQACIFHGPLNFDLNSFLNDLVLKMHLVEDSVRALFEAYDPLSDKINDLPNTDST